MDFRSHSMFPQASLFPNGTEYTVPVSPEYKVCIVIYFFNIPLPFFLLFIYLFIHLFIHLFVYFLFQCHNLLGRSQVAPQRAWSRGASAGSVSSAAGLWFDTNLKLNFMRMSRQIIVFCFFFFLSFPELCFTNANSRNKELAW